MADAVDRQWVAQCHDVTNIGKRLGYVKWHLTIFSSGANCHTFVTDASADGRNLSYDGTDEARQVTALYPPAAYEAFARLWQEWLTEDANPAGLLKIKGPVELAFLLGWQAAMRRRR